MSCETLSVYPDEIQFLDVRPNQTYIQTVEVMARCARACAWYVRARIMTHMWWRADPQRAAVNMQLSHTAEQRRTHLRGAKHPVAGPRRGQARAGQAQAAGQNAAEEEGGGALPVGRRVPDSERASACSV